jgi:hypothetical protein
MRKTALIAIMVAAIALLAPASLANGPWRVDAMQFGAPTDQVGAGAPFEVKGSGFHGPLPVKVCVDGRSCTLASVDKRGDFMETRVISTPGVHTIEVSRAQGMQIKSWTLMATASLSVVE